MAAGSGREPQTAPDIDCAGIFRHVFSIEEGRGERTSLRSRIVVSRKITKIGHVRGKRRRSWLVRIIRKVIRKD